MTGEGDVASYQRPWRIEEAVRKTLREDWDNGHLWNSQGAFDVQNLVRVAVNGVQRPADGFVEAMSGD